MIRRVVPTARALAWLLQVDPGLVRLWQYRGVIGRVCDVRTRAVGYDVADCLRIRDARHPRKTSSARRLTHTRVVCNAQTSPVNAARK